MLACRAFTRKTTSRSAEFKTIKDCPVFACAREKTSPKRTILKAELLQAHQMCCLQACLRALFSPENVQAGGVKRLKFHPISHPRLSQPFLRPELK